MLFVAGSFSGGFTQALRLCAAQAQVTERGHRTPPPVDWPDVPIDTISLFRRTGRIHQSGPRPRSPVRLASYEDVGEFVCAQTDLVAGQPPKITLRLCAGDPDWTEVLMDGACLAQVPTAKLVAKTRCARGLQTAR